MRPLVSLLVLSLAAFGCGDDDEPEASQGDSEENTAETEVPAGEATVGTVSGHVRLAEGFALPAYPLEALSGSQATSPLPEHCAPIGEDDRYPLALGESRGLRGMMVAATAADADEFTEQLGETEPKQHVVTITDCRLTPKLITATKGDQLVVRNETQHPFLPRLGPSAFMQGVQNGETVEFTMERGGVSPLLCGFGSPCGRADVVVLYRPVHTVTEDDGAFELPNVPAGMPVTIRAWHPIYGPVDASVEVTLEEGGSETLELVITPPVVAATEVDSDSDSDADSDSEQPTAEGDTEAETPAADSESD